MLQKSQKVILIKSKNKKRKVLLLLQLIYLSYEYAWHEALEYYHYKHGYDLESHT